MEKGESEEVAARGDMPRTCPGRQITLSAGRNVAVVPLRLAKVSLNPLNGVQQSRVCRSKPTTEHGAGLLTQYQQGMTTKTTRCQQRERKATSIRELFACRLLFILQSLLSFR